MGGRIQPKTCYMSIWEPKIWVDVWEQCNKMDEHLQLIRRCSPASPLKKKHLHPRFFQGFHLQGHRSKALTSWRRYLQSALTLGGSGCLDVTPLKNQQLEAKSQPIEKGKSFSKPEVLGFMFIESRMCSILKSWIFYRLDALSSSLLGISMVSHLILHRRDKCHLT